MIVDLETIRQLMPEVILVLAASAMYLGGTILRHRQWWTLFALAAYGAAVSVIYGAEGDVWRQATAEPLLDGPLVVDYLGYVTRGLTVLLGMLFTLIISQTAVRTLTSEIQATLMLLVVGLMLVARANDLVLLFVGLEMISIPTYVLLFLGRRDRATSEATVKYFFLSVLASAIFLYGLSFLYGMTGTTSLTELTGDSNPPSSAVLDREAAATAAWGISSLALIFILTGLGFKIAAVPFHFYAPDVYQGASNTNAALLAVAPKIAGVIAFIRVLVVALPQAADLAWQLALVVAMLTMTLGNVCALWQDNLRRLMAYSSIAHAGYMLIGLSVGLAAASQTGELGGVSGTITYLAVYVLASLGTFAALISLSDERFELSDVESLAGLGSTRPLAAAALAICMFSLAGIPPLAGFWGKLTLFGSALQAAHSASSANIASWFIALAVVGALNAAIAAAYYLRIVAVMYFRSAAGAPLGRSGPGPLAAMLICALLLVTIGAVPRPILQAARRSAEGLVHFRAPQAFIAAPHTEEPMAVMLRDE